MLDGDFVTEHAGMALQFEISHGSAPFANDLMLCGGIRRLIQVYC